MFKYTITLECILRQSGIEITFYPVVEWPTRNSNQSIVKKAAENRYSREHRGLFKVKAIRTSVERVRSVA